MVEPNGIYLPYTFIKIKDTLLSCYAQFQNLWKNTGSWIPWHYLPHSPFIPV
uniref:Uncharacterized protein n=1 Tax=Anguilla anguilla TaxID=7936 RepID=A0A0E9RDQ5_ANGAN